MTNEKVIEILKELWRYSKTNKYTDAEIREALELGIKSLDELKALCENEAVQEAFKDCDTCVYGSDPPDIYPCDRCCHRYINQYVYDDTREVNAAEEGGGD